MVANGTIQNGVVVLDPSVERPNDGTRVEVILPVRRAASSLGSDLLELAGTAVDLPEDLARQHDHYLHGMPKR